jgi:hypothetical protein
VAQEERRRLPGPGAMAPRVFEQVAQQQAQAGGVHQLRRHRRQLQCDGHRRREPVHRVAGQGRQIRRLGVQCAVPSGQAFALQQAADQIAHFRQVAHQGLALGAVVQQLGVDAGACQRAAQLVADGQQQGAFGVQHAAQVGRHAVDAFGQSAEFVGAFDADGPREIAGAIGCHTSADGLQRLEDAPHGEIGRTGQQQQHGQRDPAEEAWARGVRRRGQAEAQAVAVGGAAHQAPAGSAEIALRVVPVAAPAWVAVELHLRPFDAHRDGQCLGQCLGALHIGRAADLRREAIHVVGHQRPGVVLPAAVQELLHAQQEDGGRPQCQHQEQRDQPALDRMAPPWLQARTPANR